MTLVKMGRNYVNPAQVVRVAPSLDDNYAVIYFANQTNLSVLDKTVEEVVAMLNEAM